MKRNKKENKIRRYLAVSKRKIKRMTRKKAWRWLKSNVEQHPFISGIIFFAWVNRILTELIHRKGSVTKLLLPSIAIFILWFVLVVLSNLLKDKERVRWYLKKRFVFFMLVFLPPLGLIFLWSGSQFKRITKVTLTVIFALFFITTQIFSGRRYEKLINKTSFERIVDTVTKVKKSIFVKGLSEEDSKRLEFTWIRKRQKTKLAISDIASLCSPAVVSIKTKDKNGREIGMGSGFIVSKDGIIVTNFHVMESAHEAEVKVGEDLFKEVYFIKGMPQLDIAILKINSDNLPVLPIGNSDSLVSGQFIVVLGNPWGLEHSVSSGIVSAVRSRGEVQLIQMTAPVSMGSSGGPVINEYGEVIGITTLSSIFLAQNLNFAIPINYLDRIIEEK